MEHYGDGAGLLEIIKEASVLFLFDAVNSGAEPGTIHRHELGKIPLPVKLSSSSSHQFGITEGVELARVLYVFGTVPPEPSITSADRSLDMICSAVCRFFSIKILTLNVDQYNTGKVIAMGLGIDAGVRGLGGFSSRYGFAGPVRIMAERTATYAQTLIHSDVLAG